MLLLSSVAMSTSYTPPIVMALLPPTSFHETCGQASARTPDLIDLEPRTLRALARDAHRIRPAQTANIDSVKDAVLEMLGSSIHHDDDLDADIQAALDSKAGELARLRSKLQVADRWNGVLEETVKSLSKAVDESEARALLSESKLVAATLSEARLTATIEVLNQLVLSQQHEVSVRERYLRLFHAQPTLDLLAFGFKRDAIAFWRTQLQPTCRQYALPATFVALEQRVRNAPARWRGRVERLKERLAPGSLSKQRLPVSLKAGRYELIDSVTNTDGQRTTG